jgi:hypothetical protein
MSPAIPTVRYRVGTNEDLSSAIIQAISEAKGRDVSEDSCALYDAVDPDALDGIFRQDRDGDNVKVEFATHDAIVVLWGGDGVTIDVQDLESNPNYGS